MGDFWVKLIVTVVAVILLVARLIWPSLKIDAVALGLLAIAVVPWLSSLIRSAEFPGGWKVEFRDVQSAGTKITGTDDRGSSGTNGYSFQSIRSEDPNLALAGLRIEIEKRLRSLAEKNGLDSHGALVNQLDQLRRKGVIEENFASGILELVDAGNRAVHGAKVDPSVAEWALEESPRIINALDRKLNS